MILKGFCVFLTLFIKNLDKIVQNKKGLSKFYYFIDFIINSIKFFIRVLSEKFISAKVVFEFNLLHVFFYWITQGKKIRILF